MMFLLLEVEGVFRMLTFAVVLADEAVEAVEAAADVSFAYFFVIFLDFPKFESLSPIFESQTLIELLLYLCYSSQV